MAPRLIVHATDFTPAAARAFSVALALARGVRARLRIVHVLALASPFVIGATIPPPAWRALERGARRAAERRLATLRRRAVRARVRAEVRLLRGRPAEVILRDAGRARADLIVVGTRQRGRIGQFFLGSVATAVLRLARRPVLVVPARTGPSRLGHARASRGARAPRAMIIRS